MSVTLKVSLVSLVARLGAWLSAPLPATLAVTLRSSSISLNGTGRGAGKWARGGGQDMNSNLQSAQIGFNTS